MEISVRAEKPQDYREVEELTRSAFGYPERIARGGIGCPYEHWMVRELRSRGGIPELSLVAEANGRIVGHIICSKAAVRTDGGGEIPVLNFGPLSVLPALQRRGVGRALVTAMIEKAKQRGYGAIVFFGRPEYYPQFGFKEAEKFGIRDREGGSCPAFMAMELIPGYLRRAQGGRYWESDIYDDDLNRESVKEFDRQFLHQSETVKETPERK